MGGNDTHDKYGRPYELDDGSEALYHKLEDLRDSARAFLRYLDDEIEDVASLSAINIEEAVLNDVRNEFIKCFSSSDY